MSNAARRRRVRIDCSGWSHQGWRGRFHPDDLAESHWLERDATAFALAHRVDATPEDFVFAVKASRYLTAGAAA